MGIVEAIRRSDAKARDSRKLNYHRADRTTVISK